MRQLGSLPPFFDPCLFLWSHYRFGINGRGAGEVLPIGLFPLSAFRVGLPPLWRWQPREAEHCGPIRSSGRLHGACSSLSSSPLTLPGVVMTFPVCLSRAPAFRQVRVAMLAEGSLESPSVLVLAFHSSLFLVEGSSDGSAPGYRFLSPGRLCSFTPFRLRSVASALSLLGSGRFLPPLVCRFTVGSSGAFPRGNFWGSPWGLGLPVLSMVEFCLTLFLSFPGCSHPGLVGFLPLSGLTAPVWSPGRFWLLGAVSRLASPLRLLAPSFSGVGACGRQSPPCFLT